MALKTTINWLPVPKSPVLDESQIDLWWINLKEAESDPRCFDPHEYQRYQHINNLQQHSFGASHTQLRKILASYLDTPPKEIQFSIEAEGKPTLKNSALQFNLSHSKDLALIAIAKTLPVGVDIERKRVLKNLQKVAERVFDPQELEILKSNNWHIDTFLSFWTRMEARQKCIGHGIFGRCVDVDEVTTFEFDVGLDIFASLAFVKMDKELLINHYKFN